MLNRALELLVALMLAVTVVIGFTEVVARYLLGQSLGWGFEALQALLVAMTFVSAYLALRRGAHLKIDVVVRRLPVRVQGLVFVVNQLVIAGIGGVMLVWGSEQAWRFWHRESLVLEFPLGPLYALVPLSGLGIAVEGLLAIPRGLRRLRQGLPPEAEGGFGLEDEEPAR